MERSTISQAMLRVSELERIYRDKMYTMMRLDSTRVYIRIRWN